MLRTTLQQSYLKRTIRPTYAFTQATPKSQYLDPAWNNAVPIFPGMALMKTVGENVTLLGGTTGRPYGLSAFFEGGDGQYEISESGVNACAVWVMGPDAEFQILAPAFDTALGTGASWTEPTDGSIMLLTAYQSGPKRGQLCPLAGGYTTDGAASPSVPSTYPLARLISVDSTTQITVGGLSGTV